MDSVALLQQVVDETTKLVNEVTPDQLANPTPCSEWTVRDLINHITGGATMFALSAEQGSVPDELIGQLMGGDNLAGGAQSAWASASARAMAAFEQPGVIEKIVKLPFGEMPAGIALNIAIFDVATHAADLARATGQQVGDREMLDAALEIGRQMIGPDLRQPGVFGPEQPIAPNAPVEDRLLAFAGRTV